MTRRNYQKLGYVILVVLILGIVPLSQARAFDFLGVGDIANSAIVDMLTFFLSTIFAIVGQGIAIAAKALNITVNIRVGADIPVVSATWKIFRDFANMLFIIILIYMAFATIFDWSKYRFKDMFWRFLIVAVFINFSLTIGSLVIDACQVLTNLFLGSIGDIGVRLGQYLNPTALFIDPKSVSLSAGDLLGSQLISMIFSLVLALIFLFSLLTAFIFTFIRVPYIWGLLIATPFFWMGHMFPGSKYGIRQWWNQFLGWNLFLPVYLFFLYISLYFLSKRDEIMNAVIKVSGPNSPLNQPLIGTLEKSLTFNLLFFYIFVAASLVAGAGIAIKTTSMISGSNAFEGAYKKARGWAGKMTGYDIRKQAIQSAATAKFGEFQQKGFDNKYLNKIYGGKEGDERIRGKWAERFGVRGAAEARASKEVSAEKDRLQNKDTRELETMISDNSLPVRRQLAAREILKDRGQLTGSEILRTYEMYGRDNPQSALKFANSIDYGKLSAPERGILFTGIDNIEAKRKIAGIMADKGDLDTPEKIQRAASLFNVPSDRADFLKRASRRITNNETLIGMMGSGSPEEQQALREILAERQELNSNQLWETYSAYKEGSKEARDFGTKIKFDNFSKDDRRFWFDNAQDVEVKRKVAESMADKGDYKAGDPAGEEFLYIVARDLFKLDADKGDFLKKAQKKNFIGSVKARAKLGLSKDDNGNPKSEDEILFDQIKGMQPKDLAELDKSAWKTEEFKKAVARKLSELQDREKARPPKDISKPNAKWTPGAGDKFKKKIQDAISGDPDKLEQILGNPDKGIPGITFRGESKGQLEEPSEGSGEEEDEEPKDKGDQKGPGTIGYHGFNVPKANVIDLRNKPQIDIE